MRAQPRREPPTGRGAGRPSEALRKLPAGSGARASTRAIAPRGDRSRDRARAGTADKAGRRPRAMPAQVAAGPGRRSRPTSAMSARAADQAARRARRAARRRTLWRRGGRAAADASCGTAIAAARSRRRARALPSWPEHRGAPGSRARSRPLTRPARSHDPGPAEQATAFHGPLERTPSPSPSGFIGPTPSATRLARRRAPITGLPAPSPEPDPLTSRRSSRAEIGPARAAPNLAARSVTVAWTACRGRRGSLPPEFSREPQHGRPDHVADRDRATTPRSWTRSSSGCCGWPRGSSTPPTTTGTPATASRSAVTRPPAPASSPS